MLIVDDDGAYCGSRRHRLGGYHISANMESQNKDGVPFPTCHHGLGMTITPLPRRPELRRLASR